MSRALFFLPCVACALAATLAATAHRAPPVAPDGQPPARAAESLFFTALNDDPGRRDDALRALYGAFHAAPDDGGTNLFLGLCHLWIAAEGDRADPSFLQHLILARHFLQRAQRLLPDDSRIPSWLCSAERAVAAAEGDRAAKDAAEARLAAAAEADPTFHSVALVVMHWDSPADSPGFRSALAALRAAAAGADDDPSATNAPRWPHNIEGFCLAAAQCELKAGEPHRAAAMLAAAQERPSYASWPFRQLADQMLDSLPDLARRYADADPANDPPLLIGPASGISCRVCHQAR